MSLLKNGFLEKKNETWYVGLSCQYTHFMSFSSKSEYCTLICHYSIALSHAFLLRMVEMLPSYTLIIILLLHPDQFCRLIRHVYGLKNRICFVCWSADVKMSRYGFWIRQGRVFGLSDTDWHVNQPNIGNEGCMTMMISHDHTWGDWPCSFNFGSICEMPLEQYQEMGYQAGKLISFWSEK